MTTQQRKALRRALYLLAVTAEHAPNLPFVMEYDGASCDGECLAGDCEDAIDDLRDAFGIRSRAP